MSLSSSWLHEIGAHEAIALADERAIQVADLGVENKRLRAALRAGANQIEKIAFAITPPNDHTPQLITLANGMRQCAYA